MKKLDKRKQRALLRVIEGEISPVKPVWLMRQAGRYLPEYRSVRAQAGSFLDLCYKPKFAVEVTLQPIRRFGFDASILFSDILVVPHALGQNVWFSEGEGPRLEPVDSDDRFEILRDRGDPAIVKHLEPVLETVSRLRSDLPSETTLLGFCGAPWTVVSYMIGGRGSPDLGPAVSLAVRNPLLLDSMIQRLVEVQADYLIAQLKAGADAVQIFESHAGVLPPGADSVRQWCFQPIKEMIRRVRDEIPGAKIIVFARGSGLEGHCRVRDETGADVTGVDWSVDLGSLRARIGDGVVTQGNLHPKTLVEGGEKLDREIDRILELSEDKPHIFNLGHGITPQTPIANVERMLERIRR